MSARDDLVPPAPRRGDPAVTHLETLACRVPTDRPEADGTLAWDATTVVVVRVRAGGTTGTGWTYGPRACRSVVEDLLAPCVVGADPFDVPGCHERMRRAVRNAGRRGVAARALSAVDIALWDLKARSLDTSLSRLLGRCVPSAPLYGSGGFTTDDDRTLAAELRAWTLDLGLTRVKIKIGQDRGTDPRRDLDRVELARRVVGDRVGLMVDANGAYTAKQAIGLGRRLQERAQADWFEEPVSSDDRAGLALVRAEVPQDVAAGEYVDDHGDVTALLGAGAVDCLQLDVTRCGGVTGWLRAAAQAAASGLEVSGHCAPHLHAQVAVAVPNARHVEYFHDHVRVDHILFEGLPAPEGGALAPRAEEPGHGMTLRDADVAAFAA